jgi:hypothetical protein
MPATGNVTTPAEPLVTRMAKDEGRPRHARCGNQSWRVLRLRSHRWQTMAKPRSTAISRGLELLYAIHHELAFVQEGKACIRPTP